MSAPDRPLQVFLCHAHSDKDAVKALYDRLVKDGVDAWLDKEKLLPGQSWRIEIQRAVRGADVVVVCHSKEFNREGFRQREVKWALDTALEKPEGEIFIIPARLEECEVLDSLSEWQWVDLFEPNGYERLMRALRARAESIGATLQVKRSRRSGTSQPTVKTEKHIVKNTAPTSPPGMPPANQNVIDVVVEKAEIPAKGAEKPYELRTKYVVAIICTAATIIAALLGSLYIGKWFSPAPVPIATETIRVQASLTEPFIPILSTETFSQTETLILTNPDLPIEITDPKGVKMVLVAGGEFTMGSEDGDSGEQPPHTVFLDPYYIDKYEVKNAQYKACVDTGTCDLPTKTEKYDDPQYAEHPVVWVDWDMAKKYCEWRGARLPTEAEWEKAARGTDERIYPWGEGIACTYANFYGCVGGTTPVGGYESGKSPYGAYDMAGNAWEWVADWYDTSYYANSPEQNPPGPESGDGRVLRGGAWYHDARDLRSAIRGGGTGSGSYIGFRCSRSPYGF